MLCGLFGCFCGCLGSNFVADLVAHGVIVDALGLGEDACAEIGLFV